MKSRKLLAFLLACLVIAVPATVLAGCSPQEKGADSGDAAASSESYPVGSLKAAHSAGQLDNVEDYTNKLCLSCHDRATINEANENYGGTEGFNPHKAHLEAGDCVSCHSVDGTSTLTCNSCHNEDLPEGWQSAERGAGPLHDLSPES